MNDTVMAFLAVVFAVTVILLLIDYKRYIIKSIADQRALLEKYRVRIRSLEETRCDLTAEIDYHLHGRVPDVLCDAAREWRDGDISNAYASRSKMAEFKASLPGGTCVFCHMPISPGEFLCPHCGAMVNAEALRLWGGK